MRGRRWCHSRPDLYHVCRLQGPSNCQSDPVSFVMKQQPIKGSGLRARLSPTLRCSRTCGSPPVE
uniref:Uncharacterized protein n=1 Tax=Anguilla anguilla TaxID=7936 RepID=A0A0E9R1Q1_ANGAN